MTPIGMAVIGPGYRGRNLVRTAMATSALRMERTPVRSFAQGV
jgi:hypothetical protein